MKIIYIGSSGPLSLLPLQYLIDSNHQLLAVAIDNNHSDFSIINKTSDTIESLAFNKNIPVIKLDKDYSQAASKIQSYKPDVIIVSCYSRKLPESITSIPKLGCFNIHPSLLPAYRGPTPLFWQFRDGGENFGITLHRMTSDFDAGKIVLQKSLNLPDGLTMLQVYNILAQAASVLLDDMLLQLEKELINEMSQDESKASYHSFPIVSDFVVNKDWTAKRIYNFICANESDRTSFPCEIDGHVYQLIHAYSYQDGAYESMGSSKVLVEEDSIYLACEQGFIYCRYRS